MKLFVGLGNPGRKYDRNRHNVGFMAVDAILRAHNFGPPRARFQSECFEGLLGHEKILVLKPTTYMNESGRAVGEAVRFFKLDVSDVVVFHDELDLAASKVRVKIGGGHAGNNGIRSIASHIGPDFVRVRIGIGHPGEKSRVHSHVLSDFAKSDETWLTPLLNAIADNAELLAKDDAPSFQNKIHLSLAPKDQAKKSSDKKANSGKSSNKTENKD